MLQYAEQPLPKPYKKIHSKAQQMNQDVIIFKS